MRDFAFHVEVRGEKPRGLRRFIVPMRRLLVRILRPVFRRLSALIESLDEEQRTLQRRQQRMSRHLACLMNDRWDQASALRRLARLERLVENRTVHPETEEK